MPQFAVIHVQRGTPGGATGLQKHINREIDVPNADAARKCDNFYCSKPPISAVARMQQVINGQDDRLIVSHVPNTMSLNDRINKRIADGYTGKVAIRKDAVKSINIMLTGSHEQMLAIGRDNDRLMQWCNDNYNFVAGQFGGRANIVEFAVHMDEFTPHIHCVVVPLTRDGRLSAKEMIGDKKQLRWLQTDYANAMSEYELQRGILGSKAHHKEVSRFYGNFMDVQKEQREEQARTNAIRHQENCAKKTAEYKPNKPSPSQQHTYFGQHPPKKDNGMER